MSRRRRKPLPVNPFRPNPPLGVQLLEDRTAPAVFTVTNALDAGAGSLRQAILDSNALAGADEIRFDPAAFATPQTITLTSGELQVTDDLTVRGLGADRITVSGDNSSRVFNIDDGSGATARSVTVSSLTITSGSAEFGGGILNREALTLVGSVVTGNAATESGGGIESNGGYAYYESARASLAVIDSTVTGNVCAADNPYSAGGGISNRYGTLTVTGSTVSGNTAAGNGGGIFNSGTLTVMGSTVSGNSSGRYGGGVYSRSSTIALTNSTISGNTARNGGGVAIQFGVVTVTNSTLSGNTATYDGGGVWVGNPYSGSPASVTLRNATISGNMAGGEGGGVFATGYGKAGLSLVHATVIGNAAAAGGNIANRATDELKVINSVVAGAVSGGDVFWPEDGAPPVLVGVNLIEDGSVTGPGVLNGDPLLGPLADNGGSTLTHAPLVGSPLIDAADPASVPPGLTSDQRGLVFARTSGAAPDLGAVEVQPFLIVDTLLDGDDGDFSAGQFSLREAIRLANAAPARTVVTFARTLAGGTVVLTGGELVIRTDMAVGADPAARIGVSGNDSSRVFNVDDGDAATARTVTISGLTVTGGRASFGSGILNREVLDLVDSVVTGNTAAIAGAGIANGGTLTVTGSTVSDNTAANSGGGITNGGRGTLSLTNSTVSDNTADLGGGISNGGTLTVTGSTLSNNTANYGGGIYNRDSILTVAATTISGNTAILFGGGIFSSFATLTVVGSTVSGNTANYGNGGGISSRYGSLTVASSTVSGNTASSGGGISNNDGTLTVTGSTVSGNTASSGSGGGISSRDSALMVTGSSIADNVASGSGGGIDQFNSRVVLANSRLTGNTATNGAGLSLGGTATAQIADTTIADNVAQQNGGGIWADIESFLGPPIPPPPPPADLPPPPPPPGDLPPPPPPPGDLPPPPGFIEITGSTIYGNTAAVGGGVSIRGLAFLAMTNSTVSGNAAIVRGGGVAADPDAIEIFPGLPPLLIGGLVTLRHATVADNGAPLGGGVALGEGVLTILENSIIADSRAGGDVAAADPTALVLFGVNLVEDGSVIGANVINADPRLAPLAVNGGPTRTHYLAAGSPSREAADPAVTGTLALDQRGFPRVSAGQADLGAVEAIDALVVDTLADEYDGDFAAGDLSLREAVRIASGNPGVETITFAPALSGGTITLALGELLVTGDLTIAGPGAAALTISGNNASRVFNVDDGDAATARAVTITGLTVTGGRVEGDGGGIRNAEALDLIDATVSGNTTTSVGFDRSNGGGIANISGTLTVTNSTISGNAAEGEGSGGGIASSGTLALTNSTVSGNTVTYGSGGGVLSSGTLTVTNSTVSGNIMRGGFFNAGGGISSYGTLTLANSIVSGNTTDSRGGGISAGGALTVTSSTVSGNTSYSRGGGISVGYRTTASVTNSTVTGNAVTFDFGGGISSSGTLAVTGSTVSENTATGNFGSGGGIASLSGTLTVANSTVSGNRAGSGGGILGNGGPVTVANSTVSGNRAGSGGGISSRVELTVSGSSITGNAASGSGGGLALTGGSRVALTGTTVSGNSAALDGGGLSVNNGTLDTTKTTTLTNVTLSGNTAGRNGGGIFNTGRVTGTRQAISGFVLNHTTVADNGAVSGGNVANRVNGQLTLANSIVADSRSGGDVSRSGAGESLTLLGVNLVEDGSVTGAGVINADPLLAPLGSYGGPTFTHALLPGSVALNAAVGSSTTTDQRGVSRPAEAADLGAFESRGFVVAVVSGNNQGIAVNNPFDAPLVVRVTANDALEPIVGGRVTFAGPTSGAGLAASSLTATIADDGTARVTATANGIVGTYPVAATAAGATAASFTLTNEVLGVRQLAVGFGCRTFIVDAASTRTLPWANLRTIRLTFNGDASSATLADFALTGTRFGNYLAGATLSYDTATRTVTITLAANAVIGSDAWAAVVGKSGDRLTFAFRGVTRQFNVLPGDFDGNGVVNLLDINRVQQAAAPGVAYDLIADLNGDGVVNAADVILVRRWAGSVLR